MRLRPLHQLAERRLRVTEAAMTQALPAVSAFTEEQWEALRIMAQHDDEIDRRAGLAKAEAEYWEMLSENAHRLGGSR